jgi:hypothetical protein
MTAAFTEDDLFGIRFSRPPVFPSHTPSPYRTPLPSPRRQQPRRLPPPDMAPRSDKPVNADRMRRSLSGSDTGVPSPLCGANATPGLCFCTPNASLVFNDDDDFAATLPAGSMVFCAGLTVPALVSFPLDLSVL